MEVIVIDESQGRVKRNPKRKVKAMAQSKQESKDLWRGEKPDLSLVKSA